MTFSLPAGTRRIGAVLSAVIILCGCFEYEEEITLEKDGSGTVRIRARIDAEAAAVYQGGSTEKGQPPVNKGMINALSFGSRKAELGPTTIDREPKAWVYDVTLYFDDVESLANVKFFRSRKLVYRYVTAKEVRFGQSVVPTLLDLMKTQAETFQDNDYAYSFLQAIENDALKKMLAGARLTYTVIMPGTSAVGNTSDINDLGANKVSGQWSYTLGELAESELTERLNLRSTLPPEKGFTQLVILLLLASVVGILVTAIRLLLIKMKGGT